MGGVKNMKTKVLSIFVCMLVITVSMASALGLMIVKNKNMIEENHIDIKEVYKDNEDEPPVEKTDTKTGWLSIPTCAFIPIQDTVEYYIGGYGQYLVSESGCNSFYAPVNIPHNARIVKISFYWRDKNPLMNVILTLYRHMGHNYPVEEMAYVDSTYDTGDGVTSTNLIDYEVIDNHLYTYYLRIQLCDDTRFYGAYIEYNYETDSISVNQTP